MRGHLFSGNHVNVFRVSLLSIYLFKYSTRQKSTTTMPKPFKEDRILLAIQAIKNSKKNRVKPLGSRVQLGGALIIEESQALIQEKQRGKRLASEISGRTEEAVRGGPSKRRYRNYSKTGHNARTCEKDEEGFS